MTYVYYTINILLRLLYTPVILVVCLAKYLIAVQQEKVITIRIEDGTPWSNGTDDRPGSAGVDDTWSTLGTKAGLTGKA